jgi:hydrophobic/amphiphilic exporter-1 (mainly G- bacteria), HAE1 family
MSLPGLAVKRRVTFLMIFILVLGFGLFSLARLKLDMWPDITFPMVVVITQYEGAAPEDIEELVTRPVEEACAAVEGVKEVTSESKSGASVVFVEFNWGTDIDQAEIDIRKNLDMYRDYMPADAKEPLTFAFDPSLEPIMFFGVSGPYDQGKLRDICEREVKPRLERLAGVASAETAGGLKREIQVRVLPDRMAAAGVAVAQVIGALRRENMQIPAGKVTEGARELPIQTLGTFRTVEEIRDVIVGVAGAVPIRLRDVAEVVDTVQERNQIIRVNGHSGIMLMVRKQSGANTVQTAAAIHAAMPEIESHLSKGVKLNLIYNQAEFIRNSLGNLSTSGLMAVGFTMIVLFVFLRSFTAAIIVGISIPASVVVSFAAMDQAGLTLNIISLAGLALAVGMLVDNSIVVLEAIYRHMAQGKPAARAAIDGTAEVGTAVSASTLTTVAVFAPVLFVPGLAGAMFKDMAATICISLSASLLVALTFIPLGVAMFVRKLPVDPGTGLLARTYAAMQRVTLRYRKTSFALAWVALAIGVALVVVGGTDFFPKEDHGMMFTQIKAQVGSSVEATDAIMRKVEQAIDETVPERQVVTSQSGEGEGFTAMFSEGSHAGFARIKLAPLSERKRRQKDIEEALRKRLAAIPGIESTMMEPFSFSGGDDVSVEIFGHDLEVARRVGMEIKRLLKQVEGAKDVKFSMEEAKPELQVTYDRERMSQLGLATADVSSAVSAFFQGTVATVFREGGNDYDILVRAPRSFRESQKNLGDLLVVSPVAGDVPLRSIAKVTERAGPVKITRKDQQRMVSVGVTSAGGDLGGLIKRIDKKLEAYPWPEDFRFRVAGTAQDFQESFLYLGFALLAAMALVYMVMAAQYESFMTPFIIFFTVPLGMTGVGIALAATGTPLSVTALIGVVILVGVVVNNSIVLVDYANQLRERGMDRVEAVAEAGRVRLRPILMTTLTTVLGMLPMAFEIGEGSEAWSPLARVTIGGLTTATLITLLIVPNIYIWFSKWWKPTVI